MKKTRTKRPGPAGAHNGGVQPDFNGVAIDIATLCTPTLVQRIQALAQRVPPGKVLSTRSLAAYCKTTDASIRRYTLRPDLARYHHAVHPRSVVWGQPKTIADLKRRSSLRPVL